MPFLYDETCFMMRGCMLFFYDEGMHALDEKMRALVCLLLSCAPFRLLCPACDVTAMIVRN
jgi:hypothetical protein